MLRKKTSGKDIYQSTIEVYNQLGQDYIKQTFKRFPPPLNKFLKILPKGGRILDLGCGAGRDSKVFAKHGFKVTGIDASEVFIRAAKKNVPGATFKLGDIRNLKFPANYFDAIWAQAVLLHLKRQDMPKVLKNLYKILKPAGVVHIMVKQGEGSEIVKEKLSGFKPRLFTYFTEEELAKFLGQAGLKPIFSRINRDDLGRKNVKWITVWGQK